MTPTATTATTRNERERLAFAWPESPAGCEPQRDAAEREATCRRDRAGNDEAENTGHQGDRKERARRRLPSARDDSRRRESEGERRERREVVMAEERRLPPAGVPRAEDVDSEELQQRDADCHGRPEDDRTDHDGQIARASHEQRNRDREQGVLDELEVAHQVVVEERVVERRRPERLEREPASSAAPTIQSMRPAASRERPPRRGCDRGRHEHDRDSEIREADVDGRRSQTETELGLIALVDEEERDRRGEHERADRLAVDEAPEPRRHARVVEGLGRHRATIGTVSAGSVRATVSLH